MKGKVGRFVTDLAIFEYVVELIDNATTTINISSMTYDGYAQPSKLVAKALNRAAKRGVRIKILTSGPTTPLALGFAVIGVPSPDKTFQSFGGSSDTIF